LPVFILELDPLVQPQMTARCYRLRYACRIWKPLLPIWTKAKWSCAMIENRLRWTRGYSNSTTRNHIQQLTGEWNNANPIYW